MTGVFMLSKICNDLLLINDLFKFSTAWHIENLFFQRLSASTSVEVETKPTRESSLQATKKNSKDTSSKQKMATKVRYYVDSYKMSKFYH